MLGTNKIVSLESRLCQEEQNTLACFKWFLITSFDRVIKGIFLWSLLYKPGEHFYKISEVWAYFMNGPLEFLILRFIHTELDLFINYRWKFPNLALVTAEFLLMSFCFGKLWLILIVLLPTSPMWGVTVCPMTSLLWKI
jgi:hypothetical protein